MGRRRICRANEKAEKFWRGGCLNMSRLTRAPEDRSFTLSAAEPKQFNAMLCLFFLQETESHYVD
jgi:hypothetical protein